VIGRDSWEPLCREGRVRSQAILERKTALGELCRRAEATALRRAGALVEQLAVRAAGSAVGAGLESAGVGDLEMESSLTRAIAVGVTTPLIRLDSMGFIVLSGRVPRDSKLGFGEDDDEE
jgi:ATP-dependent helicase HepA